MYGGLIFGQDLFFIYSFLPSLLTYNQLTLFIYLLKLTIFVWIVFFYWILFINKSLCVKIHFHVLLSKYVSCRDSKLVTFHLHRTIVDWSSGRCFHWTCHYWDVFKQCYKHYIHMYTCMFDILFVTNTIHTTYMYVWYFIWIDLFYLYYC